MEPFDSYPEWLRESPRCLGGGSCRTGYGLRLQQITGQTACAYCGLDMVGSYHHWLHLTLDHVIPGYVAKMPGWREWVDNANNTVICCSACNAFLNGFRMPADAKPPSTFGEFVVLRSAVFHEKKTRALQRQDQERAVFEAKPWEQAIDPETLPKRP